MTTRAMIVVACGREKGGESESVYESCCEEGDGHDDGSQRHKRIAGSGNTLARCAYLQLLLQHCCF